MIHEIISTLLGLIISLQAGGLHDGSVDNSCVKITELDKDEETVKVENSCDGLRDISNWILLSSRAGQAYAFPALCIVKPGATIIVEALGPLKNDHCWSENSQESTNTIHLSWASADFVWNNDETDHACLYDRNENLVSTSAGENDDCPATVSR